LIHSRTSFSFLDIPVFTFLVPVVVGPEFCFTSLLGLDIGFAVRSEVVFLFVVVLVTVFLAGGFSPVFVHLGTPGLLSRAPGAVEVILVLSPPDGYDLAVDFFKL